MSWECIHAFEKGWGLQEKLPDEVTEQTDLYSRRLIWAEDAWRLLNIDIFEVPEEHGQLAAIHRELVRRLTEEAEERRKMMKPVKFERITIPKVLHADYRKMYEELQAALFGLREEEMPEPDVIIDVAK